MQIETSNEKTKRTYQLKNYRLEALKILSRKTRIKQVDYVREAIDGLLLKYHEMLPEYLIRCTEEDYLELQNNMKALSKLKVK